MVKKRRTTSPVSEPREAPQAAATTTADAVESTIEGFAEDLGRLLGTAQAKAEGWLGQRRLIADNLAQIRDTAQRLLNELTGGGASVRRGRAAAAGAESGASAGRGRKKRTMSPEARERIAAAQRARWARQKAGK